MVPMIFIAKHALAGVEKAPPLDPIPYQPRFIQPRFVTATYPISPEEEGMDKDFISFAWLTCSVKEKRISWRSTF